MRTRMVRLERTRENNTFGFGMAGCNLTRESGYLSDSSTEAKKMKFFLTLTAWAILLVLCWPLAILLLLLWPVLWLISIPFRIVAILVRAVLAFVRELLLLPARLLGYRVSRA